MEFFDYGIITPQQLKMDPNNLYTRSQAEIQYDYKCNKERRSHLDFFYLSLYTQMGGLFHTPTHPLHTIIT